MTARCSTPRSAHSEAFPSALQSCTSSEPLLQLSSPHQSIFAACLQAGQAASAAGAGPAPQRKQQHPTPMGPLPQLPLNTCFNQFSTASKPCCWRAGRAGRHRSRREARTPAAGSSCLPQWVPPCSDLPADPQAVILVSPPHQLAYEPCCLPAGRAGRHPSRRELSTPAAGSSTLPRWVPPCSDLPAGPKARRTRISHRPRCLLAHRAMGAAAARRATAAVIPLAVPQPVRPADPQILGPLNASPVHSSTAHADSSTQCHRASSSTQSYGAGSNLCGHPPGSELCRCACGLRTCASARAVDTAQMWMQVVGRQNSHVHEQALVSA